MEPREPEKHFRRSSPQVWIWRYRINQRSDCQWKAIGPSTVAKSPQNKKKIESSLLSTLAIRIQSRNSLF